jgi:hypothetical protein
MATILHPQHQIRPFDAKVTKTEMLAGVYTGQIAGLIMAAVMMLVFSFSSYGPLFPLQVIGSLAIGDGALSHNNLTAVVVGLILHQLTTSLIWGLVFAAAAAHLDIYKKSEALMLGLGVGILALVGPYFFVPYLMNGLHGFDFWNHFIPKPWGLAYHLIFGASFILYPTVCNWMKKREL